MSQILLSIFVFIFFLSICAGGFSSEQLGKIIDSKVVIAIKKGARYTYWLALVGALPLLWIHMSGLAQESSLDTLVKVFTFAVFAKLILSCVKDVEMARMRKKEIH